MILDGYLSIDETLYRTRVVLAFRQYNKNKPAKYGLLFCSINSAEMPYIYSSTLYPGKPPGEPNKHYLTSTDYIIKHLVSSFSYHTNLQGRNISIVCCWKLVAGKENDGCWKNQDKLERCW